MGLYYALGSALVNRDELIEKRASGALRTFSADRAADPAAAVLSFSNGELRATDSARTIRAPDGETVPFVPIGSGLPLTIQLRRVWTGEQPRSDWLSLGDKSMLLTSAVKSIGTYDAAPRAVNYLSRNVAKRSDFTAPPATEQGTPVIYYSPAVTDPSLTMTLEVAFDNFPKELFDTLSAAFSAAGGIPIFAPASLYLLAAGIVSKIVGSIGQSLFNSSPVFRHSEQIAFDMPGSVMATARFALLLDESLDPSILPDYKIDNEARLVLIDGGASYAGNAPYLIISLDGAKRDSLKAFTPTAATAAVLNKFLNISDGKSQPLDPLIEGLKLVNDLKFRKTADDLAKQIAAAGTNTDEGKKLAAERDAALKNIFNDILKPPST